VTVKDLMVKRYANSNGYGAIGYQTSGDNWVINNVASRENHGAGIDASGGWQVLNSRMKRNGQMGYSCAGVGGVFDGVTVDSNNTNGNTAGANGEAGSGKCSGSSGTIIRNSFFRFNHGPGPWFDVSASDALIELSVIEDNDWRGIFYEISYGAIIRNNQVRRNGFNTPFATPGACDRAGIFISNSPNVEVYGNTVENNFHGITGLEADRGSGSQGPHNVTNLSVHDNTVRQIDDGRAAGICDSDPNANPYSVAANNDWLNNDYFHGATTKWRWLPNADVSLDDWQGAQDAGSTFTLVP
jgi:hypothetical protein